MLGNGHSKTTGWSDSLVWTTTYALCEVESPRLSPGDRAATCPHWQVAVEVGLSPDGGPARDPGDSGGTLQEDLVEPFKKPLFKFVVCHHGIL